MEVHYNEKLVENFIKKFPEQILGEKLNFRHQQLNLNGYYPDLIFADQEDNVVIVEVQINQLDRLHLYKSLEYRDLYLEHINSNANVRMIVFANSISNRYNSILKTHAIESIIISRRKLLKKIKTLEPKTKFHNEIERRINQSRTLTPLGLLSKIKDSDVFDKNDFNFEAIIFYQFSGKGDYNQYSSDLSFDLRKSDGKYARYSRDYNSNLRYENSVPTEIIVNEKIKSLNKDQLEMIQDWINVLDVNNFIGDFSEGEVILGFRGSPDFFNYSYYVHNRVKKFQAIWNRYRENRAFNKSKISQDLDKINSITFYTGKYPNYKGQNLFKSYSYSDDAGSLMENWEIDLNEMTNFRSEEFIESIKKDYESYMKIYSWLTIKFNKINLNVLNGLQDLTSHILEGHQDFSSSGHSINLNRKCHICPIPPKEIRLVENKLLEQTSQFFKHYRT